jgi:D-alanyl-D-alanine dipeptidase
MLDDLRAIAVDVPHRGRQIDLVLATVEHGDLVAARDELSHHARTDEDRSADNEDATHRAILPPVLTLRQDSGG